MCRDEEELLQGGSRRPEQGQVGNYGSVDSGDMAGMPRQQTPPSSSPAEHHPKERASKHTALLHAQPHSSLCGVLGFR